MRRGFAPIFVVLIFTLIAIGAYYFIKTSPAASQSTIQQQSPTPSPTTDNTANWKTYINNKYGFQLLYPPSWQVKEFDISQDSEALFWLLISPSPNNDRTILYPWKDLPSINDGLHIIVTHKQNQENDLIRTGYNCNLENEGCVLLFKRQPTKFLGLMANQSVAEFPDQPELYKSFGNKVQPYTYIIFNHQSNGWVVAYNYADFSGNHDPLFEQILSTFRFD